MNFHFVKFIFLFLIPFNIFCDDIDDIINNIREKDDNSLFSYNNTKIDLDLYGSGMWEANLNTGFSMGFTSEGQKLKNYIVKDFIPFSFINKIDLSLSLFLWQKLFLEANFNNNFKNSQISLGYDGKGRNPDNSINEVVDLALISNNNISFNPYPYISFSKGLLGSFGAMLDLNSPISTHNLMLRYEPSKSETLEFTGYDSLENSKIKINDWIRASVFFLPDKNIDEIEILTLYKEGIKGNDNLIYKKIEEGYILDKKEGVIYFKTPQDKKIIVYYKKNQAVGLQEGDRKFFAIDQNGVPDKDKTFNYSFNSLTFKKYYIDPINNFYGKSITLEDFKVKINNKDYLVIYDNSLLSPFESRSYYKRNINDNDLEIQLTKDDKIIKNLNVFIIPETEYFTVENKGVYAFLNEIVKIYAFNYIYEGYSLNISNIKKNNDNFIALPALFPGSLVVMKNGTLTNDYNIQDNNLIFNNLNIYDNIKLQYQIKGDNLNNGNILFGLGNKFYLYENLFLNLGFGLNWSAGKDQEINDNNGSIINSASLVYQNEEKGIDLNVKSAFLYTQLANNGIVRLLSMDDFKSKIKLIDYTLSPPSLPNNKNLKRIQLSNNFTLTLLNQQNRGKLYFKDYYYNGSYLNYDNNLTNDKIYDYKQGSKIGPYLANNKEIDTSTLIIDFSNIKDQWNGARINFNNYKDLSNISNISFYLKTNLKQNSKIKLFLEIGDLTEDLDNINIKNNYQIGKIFHDSTNNINLIYDYNNLGDEDFNQNNAIDGGNDNFVNTYYIDKYEISQDWKKIDIKLTNKESALLKKSNAFQFIIVSENNSEGKLLFSELSLQGSNYYKKSVKENFYSYQYDSSYEIKNLVNKYPELDENFQIIKNKSSLLKNEWNFNENSDWELSFNTNIDISIYKNLFFFLRTIYLKGLKNNLIIEGLDKNNNIIFDIDLNLIDNDEWDRIEILFDNKEVIYNHQKINFHIKNNNIVTKLNIKLNNTKSGILLLDEFYLKGSNNLQDGIGEINFNYNLVNPIIINNFSLLNKLNISQDFIVKTPFFHDIYIPIDNNDIINSNTFLDLELFYIGLKTNFDIRYNKKEYSIRKESHIIFPLVNSFFKIEDHFTSDDKQDNKYFLRNSNLNIDFNFLNVNLNQIFKMDKDGIDNNWNINGGFNINDYYSAGLNFNVNNKSDDLLFLLDRFYLYQYLYSYIFLFSDKSLNKTNRNFNFNIYSSILKSNFDFNFSNKYYVNTLLNVLSNSFNLSIPITDYVNLSYERMHNFEYNKFSPSFKNDLLMSSQNLMNDSMIFSQWFILDSFYPFDHDLFLIRSKKYPYSLYNSNLNITYANNILSNYLTLFLPSYINLKFSSYQKKNIDVTEKGNEIELTYITKSIDLFGINGIYELSDNFINDELINEINLDINFYKDKLNSLEIEYDFNLKLISLFKIKKEQPWDKGIAKTILPNSLYKFEDEPFTFNLENKFIVGLAKYGIISEDILLDYSWANDFGSLKETKILLNLKKINTYFFHKESFEFHFAIPFKSNLASNASINTPNISKDNLNISLFLAHETALRFPGIGYISAKLEFGWENYQDQLTKVIIDGVGFKFSIFAKLFL